MPIVSNQFQPPWWAKNRHVQTIWPRFLQKRSRLTTTTEILTLPDGDSLDLAWSPKPEECKGLAVMFHGLEGSIHSHYANDMMAHLVANGWWAVLMHFRGCNGVPNSKLRSYHSGETEDANYLFSYLKQQMLKVETVVALGFSLGGNMLLKLLGEQPQQDFIKAAAVVSPPMKLAECSNSINRGFSKQYQRYLLKSMRGNVLKKAQNMPLLDTLSLQESEVKAISSFRQFDQLITAPLHGFKGAEDYYQQCSSAQYLKNIKTPTLIIHAKDDPFMSDKVVPDASELSDSVELNVSEKGGHVGFMQGTPWRPRIWFHEQVTRYFSKITQ